MKINISPDCGNSPKREFIKEFNLAFFLGKTDFIIEHVSDDITWEIFGDKTINGKADFEKEIQTMGGCPADELSVHQIITHGKEAASRGEFTMGEKTYAFSDFYVFKSAGSKSITKLYSYIILKHQN